MTDPTGARCLGCVYLNPLRPEESALCAGAKRAVRASFWVRASEIERDLHLLEALREWLATEWVFDYVAFTLSRKDARQAALFAAAGPALLGEIVLQDGRECAVYGSPSSAR